MINRIKFRIIISILLGISSFTFAQVNPKPKNDFSNRIKTQTYRTNYQTLDLINSNRPGFSVSAYNVGKGNFQVETGIVGYSELLGINDKYGSKKNIGLDVTLRYAFNDKIEVFSNLSSKKYWYDVEGNLSDDFSMLPTSVGISYRLNNGERVIPTMSIRGKVSYFEKYNESPNTDVSFAFVTQNEITSNLVFITNWNVDNLITGTDLSAICSLTNTISTNWSWFAEYYVSYYDKEFNHFLNAGLAYLVNDNLQLDFFGGTNLDINKTTYYLSAGLSWRLGKSLDRSKYHNPQGAERVDHRVYKKFNNKGVK